MTLPFPTIAELRRLYFHEQLTLAEIGRRYGITRQAVHDRFKRAGVDLPARQPPRKAVVIEAETLQELYEKQGLSAREISERLGHPVSTVYSSLRHHSITIRGPGQRPKYPVLRNLAVGESVILPRRAGTRKFHLSFYEMAKPLGIRVSVTTVDEVTARITRIE